MGTRIRVSLFLIGTWLTFVAFVVLVLLAATGHFTWFTGTAIVVCFMLNWILFIPAQSLILERAEKMRQAKWIFTFKIVKKLPFVVSCIATVYAITWPDLPERERRVF
jgi:hypothetical protein